MMCADAKKVTAGVNKHGGDVDMFGHEAEPTLNDRKDGLQSDLKFVDEIKKPLSSIDFETNLDTCWIRDQFILLCRKLSCRLHEEENSNSNRNMVCKNLFQWLAMTGEILNTSML